MPAADDTVVQEGELHQLQSRLERTEKAMAQILKAMGHVPEDLDDADDDEDEQQQQHEDDVVEEVDADQPPRPGRELQQPHPNSGRSEILLSSSSSVSSSATPVFSAALSVDDIRPTPTPTPKVVSIRAFEQNLQHQSSKTVVEDVIAKCETETMPVASGGDNSDDARREGEDGTGALAGDGYTIKDFGEQEKNEPKNEPKNERRGSGAKKSPLELEIVEDVAAIEEEGATASESREEKSPMVDSLSEAVERNVPASSGRRPLPVSTVLYLFLGGHCTINT